MRTISLFSAQENLLIDVQEALDESDVAALIELTAQADHMGLGDHAIVLSGKSEVSDSSEKTNERAGME